MKNVPESIDEVIFLIRGKMIHRELDRAVSDADLNKIREKIAQLEQDYKVWKESKEDES